MEGWIRGDGERLGDLDVFDMNVIACGYGILKAGWNIFFLMAFAV